MKSIVFSALFAGAAAFAPASQKSSTALKASDSPFAGEVGAQPPFGFWDPMGLTEGISKEEFDRIRWVELKHGRVSMLAVVGYLVTAAGVRFPGAEDIPSGFAALDAVPGMVWAQVFFTGALMEAANRDLSGTPGISDKWTGSTIPGDFRNGFIDYGWDKFDDATKIRKQAIEINNGRAAMAGILGLMVHDKLGNVDSFFP